jgi:hypothetical protein
MMLEGGSRLALTYSVPIVGVGSAIGLYALGVLGWLLRGSRPWVRAWLLGCCIVLALATHRIVDDALSGTVTDEWALVPIQTLSYPVADGPAPRWTRNGVMLVIASPDSEIVTFAGVPPWQVKVPPEVE